MWWMEWIELAQGQVVGTCKCDNEPSGSIKYGELDWLRTHQLLKEDSAPWSKYVIKYTVGILIVLYLPAQSKCDTKKNVSVHILHFQLQVQGD